MSKDNIIIGSKYGDGGNILIGTVYGGVIPTTTTTTTSTTTTTTTTTTAAPLIPAVVNFYNCVNAGWCKSGYFCITPTLTLPTQCVEVSLDMAIKAFGGYSTVSVDCCNGTNIALLVNNIVCQTCTVCLMMNYGGCYCYFVQSTGTSGSEACIRLQYVVTSSADLNASISPSSNCIEIHI